MPHWIYLVPVIVVIGGILWLFMIERGIHAGLAFTATAMVCGGIITGYTLGHEGSAVLPNVSKLCRGSIEFSWRVSKSDAETITKELKETAGCQVSISIAPSPADFPPYNK